ncbi:hypothetical protein PCASD_08225 [Puccinia coronata f. sp. avenae]|uniref:Uncharacterized protein n=1 Tax=Puccinia coronata f. sp. avenae TaxID=200324 RepID=A0A2N5ULJ5_9BASI|nr:hypothetical protein PCASD_08225 [Puccinia coronata f. sp. avenae]
MHDPAIVFLETTPAISQNPSHNRRHSRRNIYIPTYHRSAPPHSAIPPIHPRKLGRRLHTSRRLGIEEGAISLVVKAVNTLGLPEKLVKV